MEFLSPAEWQTEVLTVHQHPAMSRNLVSAACKERNIRCMIVKGDGNPDVYYVSVERS